MVSVVVAVVAALAYAKFQTPTYQSSALIQLTASTSAAGTGTALVSFPDPVQMLDSTAVQLGAAKILGDPNVATVAADVTGTVDTTTGALTITASDSSPNKAEAVAKAYSAAFVNQTQDLVQAQMNKITGQIDQLKSEIAALQAQSNSGSNGLIGAQITSLTTTYGNLQTELSTIQLGEPYATIQVAPALPGSPTGLSKSKLLAIGFLAGLLVGCGIALVRDQFDTRLRASPDLESLSESPILAELPQDSDVRAGKVAIAMVQAPQSQMAEAIRELRTSLRVILDETPCPVVIVTSPEAGDGKTFVTANLAAAWAMSGSKVIVVSADFRRPRLEEIFGLETFGMPGLADLIKANWKNPEPDNRPSAPREDQSSGSRPDGRRTAATSRPSPTRSRRAIRPDADESSVSSMLVETGIWGVQLLPAGTYLDNPSELFGSPGIQPVIDQLPLLADVVLIDTPPVLAAPDTAILGSLAHGAVVVASEGRTDRADLERTIHRLQAIHCRVLGVALNRVRRSSADTYQSYAYKQ